MVNIVLDRIKRQAYKPHHVHEVPTVAIPVLSNPVPEDILYALFLKELTVEVPIVVVEQQRHIDFPNVFVFVEWYLEHQQEFPVAQQQALNTLVQTRDMVLKGCNCKRQIHEHHANNYYLDFWNKNRPTDMIPTVMQIAKVSSITFGNIRYPDTPV